MSLSSTSNIRGLLLVSDEESIRAEPMGEDVEDVEEGAWGLEDALPDARGEGPSVSEVWLETLRFAGYRAGLPESCIEWDDPTMGGPRLSNDGDSKLPVNGLGAECLDRSAITDDASEGFKHGGGDTGFGSRQFKIPLASFCGPQGRRTISTESAICDHCFLVSFEQSMSLRKIRMLGNAVCKCCDPSSDKSLSFASKISMCSSADQGTSFSPYHSVIY